MFGLASAVMVNLEPMFEMQGPGGVWYSPLGTVAKDLLEATLIADTVSFSLSNALEFWRKG